MPELKNLFVKGKMNKDLDERLLPQGEYRDALNINVSYSEGSDVGTLENILGNGSALDSISLTNASCIGSVRDTENDKIYWFITSDSKDLIVELDGSTVSPIVVDTGSILNFSTNKDNYITGVNVLDGILYFTDNLNEPRQVDINYWKTQSNGNFNDTTSGLSADRITVIKKSPFSAPSLTLSNTKRSTKKTRLNHRFLNFVDKSVFSAGDQPVEVGDTTSYSFSSSDLFSNYQWQVGDKLKIYNDNYDAYAIEEVTTVVSNGFTGTIKALVGEFPDERLYWNAELIEEPILYESKFIRFAYRWKYEINDTTQYSLISSFSETAFIPGNFKYNTLKGFNLAMENTLQKITISGFETSPTDATKIEILLKYSDSPNIYKIKELDASETSFSFEKEILGEAIPSNQLLRLYDSVPKKAKSQEIVANRLIYGNYTQNFDVPTNPAFEIGLINRSGTSNSSQSIKTARNYQFGVVYFDEYNRQTPVFTDTSGSFSVPFGGTDDLSQLFGASQFKAKITTSAPSWASKYKYYIKENTDEYYNLALAGAHKTDDGFYYLAFPSSEVNKVQEGDYIIMKKSFNNIIIENFEKNKILSIEQEAPDKIAKEKIKEIIISNAAFSPALEDNRYVVSQAAGSTPTPNSNQFVLAGRRKTPGTLWDGDGTPSGSDYQGEGLSTEQLDKIKASTHVRFSIGNAKTKYYKISKTIDTDFLYYGATTNDLRNHIEITLEDSFSDDVDFLYEYRGQNSSFSVSLDDYALKPNISVTFYTESDISKNFAGQFFVKVEQNAVLNNNIQIDTERIITDGTTLRTDINIDAGGAGTGKWHINGGGKAGDPDNSIDRTAGGAEQYDNITWQLTLHHRSYTDLSPNYPFEDSIAIGSKFRFKDYQAVSANFSKEEAFMGIATAEVVSGGTGYTSASNVAVTGGSGENLTISFTAVSGAIVSASAGDNAGVGYKNGDIVTVSGGDENATLRLTVVEEEVYTITDYRILRNQGSNPQVDVFHINFDKNFIKDLPFYNSNNGYEGDFIEVEVIEDKEKFDLSKEKKPPIFETYPDENELELFYETQETFPISAHGNFNNLKWFNCFTFNNGVESNRIRDDFNALQITKGAKVSTTFEEEYQEENVKTGLIFSGIYNRKNGVNRLNQFIIAEPITKDLNPEYGSIQLLHTRDSDVIAFCEDKLVKILANKDALFNADGNPNLVSTNLVLGQAVIPPTFGAYGISKNPESFVDHVYRGYFTDKNRGKVLRLSIDGVTEISNYGMKDYFKDKLSSNNGLIIGSFDENKGQYNVTFSDDTVSFSESVNGWPSRKSFIPESGISLNNVYYTFKDGHIYKHDNTTRNTFYGTKTDSEVTFYLNGNPGNIKNFRTLNYQGDNGWTAETLSTDTQAGEVTSFIKKENIYYNYISGVTETTKANLDLKSLNIQGLGTPVSISNNDAAFSKLNNALQVGDKVYNNTDSSYKTVTAISGNTITLDSAPTNDFSFFVKDNKFNTSGILGYYLEATLKNQSTDKKELYSVGSEVSLSS